ncbi:hypothetical protein [Streptomyces phaeochromogenes]|nr:hypothetical protein OHB08_50355 [Streptomyces phaeochromogenes]
MPRRRLTQLWRGRLPSTVPKWLKLLRGASMSASALLIAALVVT